MAVQAIGGGAATSFMQANRQAERVGGQTTAKLMYESLPQGSANGSSTELGTSEFRKANDEVIEVSVEAVSSIMEQDDDFASVSNLGTESVLGPTGFNEMNDRSYNARQQVAASAYNYFNG